MTDMKQIARRALSMLDLTNLNDDCDEDAIAALAARACTDHGHVAALCVWPAFVEQAHGLVGHRGVKVATVVNFPRGDDPVSEVTDLTKKAIGDGADEIDLVIPYRSLMEGREEVVMTRIKRVKSAAGGATVKAILETGVLNDADLIRKASDLAIEAGADFIKTSTGNGTGQRDAIRGPHHADSDQGKRRICWVQACRRGEDDRTGRPLPRPCG